MAWNLLLPGLHAVFYRKADDKRVPEPPPSYWTEGSASFLLTAANTACVLASSALWMTFGAGFAAIVAIALLNGIVDVHNADTVNTSTFLLGHINH